MGRKADLPPEVLVRIRALRDSGMSLRAMAERLLADGIPTAHGGKTWHASTVKAVLESRTAKTASQPQKRS